MGEFDLSKIIKGIIAYGLVAILAKTLHFLVIFYLEFSLSKTSFVEFGLKYAFQSGVVVFSIFGINEGLVPKFVGAQTKSIVLENSVKIVTISQLLILLISIPLFIFFKHEIYIYPLINGTILGNLLLTSTNFKLLEKHSKARFFLYTPQIIFHVIILISYYKSWIIDPFSIASFFLISFLIVFNGNNILGSIRSKLNEGFSNELFFESIAYYLIAILGYISGLGFTWVIKILFNTSDIADYVYLFSYVGVILLLTTSIFSVWDPYYLNKNNNISIYKQDTVYEVVSLSLSLICVILSLTLYLFKDGFGMKYINFSLLLSSYVFYVPVWRSRLYFLELGKGWFFMQLTSISLVVSFVFFLIAQVFLGSMSIYLFFVFKSIILALLCVKEFRNNEKYKLKYRFQLLLGLISITAVYFTYISIFIPLGYSFIVLLIGAFKLKKIARW